MTLATLWPWFALAVSLTVWGAAIWKGDWEERATALAMLIAFLATLVLRDRNWAGTQWGAFGVDLLLLGFMGGVALRTRKFWPLFATGFHLLAVVTHAAQLIDPAMGAWAYATAAVIWGQLTIVAIGVGTWGAWRSRAQPTSAAATGPGATRR